MHQQRVNVVNGNPFAETGLERKKFEVGFVKRGIETAEQVGERQLGLAETVVAGRVDEPGFVAAAHHEVACPQIAVQQGRIFLWNDGTEPATEVFDAFVEIDTDFLFHEAIADDGQDAVLDEKIDAVRFPLVGKCDRGQIIGIRMAELIVPLLMQSGKLPSGFGESRFCGGRFVDEIGDQKIVALRFSVSNHVWYRQKRTEQFEIGRFGLEKTGLRPLVEFDKKDALGGRNPGAGIDDTGSGNRKIQNFDVLPEALEKNGFKDLLVGGGDGHSGSAAWITRFRVFPADGIDVKFLMHEEAFFVHLVEKSLPFLKNNGFGIGEGRSIYIFTA